MKLISILIPTYNRDVFLDASLEVLVPQVLEYENLVEIIISDNASVDNTEEIVKKYSSIITIKYNKNKENIGFAKNFEFLIRESSGQYIYLMGDDDIVSPNFFQIIIDLLHHNDNCSIVHWNRLTGDSECKNSFIVDNNFVETTWIGSATDFIYKIRDKANFISSLLFHRECWDLGKAHVKEEYAGYEWFAQLYWGLLLRKRECVYYYFPLVIQRNPAKAWIKFWLQYFAGSMSNIFFDLDTEVYGLYEKWKEKLRIEVIHYLPAVGRHRDYYKREEIKSLIFRHLTKKEKLLYNYYLIPGAYFMFLVKLKIRQLWKKLFN